MKNGETRRGPRSRKVSAVSAIPSTPPLPEPIKTPLVIWSSYSLGCEPASSSACVAAAMAKMMKSSTLRCSFGSIHWSGLKLPLLPSPRGTWPAILQGISETSNFSIALMPLSPAKSRCQVCCVPQASGVTSPSPVTTTRLITGTPGARSPNIVPPHMAICGDHGSPRPSCKKMPAGDRLALCVLFEKFDGVADGQNRLGGIVGNFTAEFLFKGHDQLDGVETVRAEVVDEAGVLGHLIGLDAEMFHDDLLHPLANVTHRSNLILHRDPSSSLSFGPTTSLNCRQPWVDTERRRQRRTLRPALRDSGSPARVRFGYHTSKRLASAP